MMNLAFILTSSVKYPVTIGATTPGIVPKVLVIPSRNPAYLQEQETKYLFVTVSFIQVFIRSVDSDYQCIVHLSDLQLLCVSRFRGLNC